MSSNLYWRRVPVNPEGEDLPSALKYKLAPRYLDHDGSLGTDWVTLGAEEIPYLEGLRDGSTDPEVRKGIETLLVALRSDGAVQICTIN